MKHISQPDLIVDIGKILTKRHGIKTLTQRQFNAVIDAANLIIKALAREDVYATPSMGLAAWLKSDDTGSSSLYMAHVLASGPMCDYAYPLDPADFGRCYRLLEAVPGLRVTLDFMRTKGPEWKGLVDAWTELETLYREELPTGTCPKLYARIKELIDGARAS